MISEHVISMPDKWEYPWFAAWDLAFHTITHRPTRTLAEIGKPYFAEATHDWRHYCSKKSDRMVPEPAPSQYRNRHRESPSGVMPSSNSALSEPLPSVPEPERLYIYREEGGGCGARRAMSGGNDTTCTVPGVGAHSNGATVEARTNGFCCNAHRPHYWRALRECASRIFNTGLISIDDLRRPMARLFVVKATRDRTAGHSISQQHAWRAGRRQTGMKAHPVGDSALRARMCTACPAKPGVSASSISPGKLA
jgi:hypothetical protein